MEVERAYSI